MEIKYYYTSIIPNELAIKLTKVGMPKREFDFILNKEYYELEEIQTDKRFNITNKIRNKYATPTFGEVLDWLLSEKKYLISILYNKNNNSWIYFINNIIDNKENSFIVEDKLCNSWYKTVIDAIEKIIKLIQND